MKEEVKEEKKKFELPNKKIKVSPIRRKGTWLGTTHAANFLFGSATKKYMVPLVDRGRVAKILTNEEEEFLSNAIDRDLSVFKVKKDNYWMNHWVGLKDEVKILDLSDPQDYINWKIILSNKDEIAPSGDQKYSKGTYKFVISDLDFEDNLKSKSLANKRDAYTFSGKLVAGGRTAVSDFLTAYYFGKPGKRVPENASMTWLEAELDNIIENDLAGFLFISKDADYEYKILIGKAVAKKAIYKDGSRYSLPDGGLIAANLDALLLWIKSPENSEEVIKIEAKILN